MAQTTESNQETYTHLVTRYYRLNLKLSKTRVDFEDCDGEKTPEYMRLKEKQEVVEEKLDTLISEFDEEDFRIAFERIGIWRGDRMSARNVDSAGNTIKGPHLKVVTFNLQRGSGSALGVKR